MIGGVDIFHIEGGVFAHQDASAQMDLHESPLTLNQSCSHGDTSKLLKTTHALRRFDSRSDAASVNRHPRACAASIIARGAVFLRVDGFDGVHYNTQYKAQDQNSSSMVVGFARQARA